MDIRLRSKKDPNQIIQVLDQHYREVLEPQGQWIPIDADGNEIVGKIRTVDEVTALKEQIEEMQKAVLAAEEVQQQVVKPKTRTRKAG